MHIEGVAVGQCLLHTDAEEVLVVLGLDHRDELVLMVSHQVVGTAQLSREYSRPRTMMRPAVPLDVPAGTLQRRGDELRADVPCAEGLLVHGSTLLVVG